MYQLTMSTIHDLREDQKYDSDSFVHGIPDAGTALQAMIRYVRVLSEAYGITFHMQEGSAPGEDSPTLFGMWAEMPAVGRGPASVYVEVQESKERSDLDDIVNMMRVNARFANPDQYYGDN